MRRAALVLIAGAIMAAMGSTAAFAAVPSTVSVGYNHTTERFHGVVGSSDAECQAGRTVKVFKQGTNGPELQGRVMSGADGHWKIEVMHASGHYFAKIPAQKVMHTHCGGAKSRTVDVM